MKTPRLSIAIVALAGVALSAPAGASVIPKMSLEQVYARADRAVQGTVIAQSSAWKELDGNRLIITHSTIQVTRAWKQAAPADGRIIVRTIGGEVDGYHQTLLGEAALSLNEEVIVFVQDEEGWQRPSVVGFYQGKYRVERGAADQAASLVRHGGQRPGSPGKIDRRGSMTSFLRRLDELERGKPGVAPASAGEIHPLTPAKP